VLCPGRGTGNRGSLRRLPHLREVATQSFGSFVATPLSRIFGVISSFDEVTSLSAALAAWTAIGMGPALVDIDVTTTPCGAAQRFITATIPATGLTTRFPNHKVLTADLNTPLRQACRLWHELGEP
jgi:hypothetical protein